MKLQLSSVLFHGFAKAVLLLLSNSVSINAAVESNISEVGWYTNDNPHPSWTNHTYHPHVKYAPLDEIHGKWKDGYFDYVFDSRGLNDTAWNTTNGLIPLEGWETRHIPGSYPLNAAPNLGPDGAYVTIDNVTFLSNGVTAPACLDSRIFIHCWLGVQANQAAELLVRLGYTNVYAAGPEGDAGLWKWAAEGWDLVYNDTFDPDRVIPCAAPVEKEVTTTTTEATTTTKVEVKTTTTTAVATTTTTETPKFKDDSSTSKASTGLALVLGSLALALAVL